MASVNSYGGATTAGNYTLVYSGITIGTWVEDVNITPKANAEPNMRFNFWGSKPVIDNSDAAVGYEIEANIYTAGTSPGDLINTYLTLVGYTTDSTPRNTTINSGGTATVVCSLGNCIITEITPSDGMDPYNFLFNEARFTVRLISEDPPSYT